MKRGLLLLLILIFVIGCSSPVKVEVAPIKEPPAIPSEQQNTQETPEETTGTIKEINVVAKQFAFEPDPIVVNKGDKVKLILTTADVAHSFTVLEYGINKKVVPGETAIVEFTADKVGEFEVLCAVFCGSGHNHMKGKLVVQ